MQRRIFFQHHFYLYPVACKIPVEQQAVAKKITCRCSEADMRTVEREVTAIVQQPVYIDIIIRAFFQAVGIQVYINAVNLLCPGDGCK